MSLGTISCLALKVRKVQIFEISVLQDVHLQQEPLQPPISPYILRAGCRLIWSPPADCHHGAIHMAVFLMCLMWQETDVGWFLGFAYLFDNCLCACQPPQSPKALNQLEGWRRLCRTKSFRKVLESKTETSDPKFKNATQYSPQS